ncbi:MAG: NAD-dependent epimerase/dehydratase family protein [Flavobacteriales bacterium]|nr:NAD-dependent epimerase/dehydratase family protein [Flavobacteriales bacterium]
MKIEHVLITGVAGFIGSNLLDYLLEHTDWKITGIDNYSTGRKNNIGHNLENERFEFIEDSLFNIKSLKPYHCVFHMAALPRIQPSFELVNDHIKQNLMGSTFLIELMIADNYFPRIVNSSSSAIYGTPNVIPTPESEKVDCLNPYAFQKYETEKYFDLLSTRYPLDYVHLRYFNPYGPRSFNPENQFNAYSSVVGIFLNRNENGESLQITGDGSQKRDFIHVYDLARANHMAAMHPETINTAFNIGHSDTLSILELAHMISDRVEFIPKRDGEAEITYADVDKAKSVLGWEPVYKLEDYIKKATA